MSFFDELQYSSCSEDFSSEWATLDVKTGDQILAVCGGGGRALAFLAEDVAKVWVIDANPHQIAMARLKSEMMARLERKDFLDVCGVRSSRESREKIISSLEGAISSESRFFLRKHRRNIVNKGLLFIGKVEKHFMFCASILQFIWRPELNVLAQSSERFERERVADMLKNSRLWNRLLKLGTTPDVYRVFLQNIGWFTKRSHQLNVPGHLMQRIDASIRNFGLRRSHLLALVFAGSYDSVDEDCLPHYLRSGWYEKIRQRVDRLEFVLGDVSSVFPEGLRGRVAKISLSNVPSYLDDGARARIWKMFSRNLGSSSIICERRFLGNTEISPDILAQFREHPERELELAQSDSSFAYDFRVLTKK